MTALAVVSIVLAVVGSGVALGWWARGPRSLRAATTAGSALVVVLLAAALTADAAPPVGAAPWQHWLVLASTGLAGVLGGGAITVAVLTVADRRVGRDSRPATTGALRGGAWIGVLERLGIFASLTAGYPSAAVVILAIKGLARYPELRAGPHAGIAERFIIGTFTSLLVAAGAAGTAQLLLG